MKLFAPLVYLYYFFKGIVTSPLYAWRRTVSHYKPFKPKTEKNFPGPKFVGTGYSDRDLNADQPHRRRKHRGGRKHKKFRKFNNNK